MRYAVLIDGKPGAYGVVFPDLPGCTAMGATLDEALYAASDAAAVWARVLEADGGTVPAPREFTELRKDTEVQVAIEEGAVWASVPLVREGRPVKANLSLDSEVLVQIDRAADRHGRTRSGMVEMLARIALPQLA